MKTLARLEARLDAAGVRLPSRKVCALLVVVFLGFGIGIGRAARSSVEDESLASTGAPVRVVVPAAKPPATPAEVPAPTAPASEGEGQAEAQGPAATVSQATLPPAATPPAEPTATQPHSAAPTTRPATKLPAIGHVFVIVLSDEPYAGAFGPISPAHYLVGKLEPRGALLARYDAIAHEELPNEIALLSGQGPTEQTAGDCPTYAPLSATGSGADGQVIGSGCVYPASTPTLPGQLAAKHLSWRAYVEGIGEGRTPLPACDHPALGAADPTATPAGGPYATFHNPFSYFAALTGSGACAHNEVGLGRLRHDLAKAAATPSFSYIIPGSCDDGSPQPCAPGASAGMVPADAFLRRVVPEITAAPAYKHDGLLAITVDEAPSSGEFGDSSSCCGQPRFPNLPAAAGVSGRAPGGGAVGALLLSPFIKGPVSSQEPYNHFSLLATFEQLFGVKRLGYAALPAVKTLEPSLFTASSG